MMTELIKRTSLYVMVVILLIFTGYPFLYMVSTSLKSMNEFFVNPFQVIPESFTFQNL
ncbi:hypothetical protein [Sinobaca sp. H24]|uniref:hypothetical protein n=1 Tax=Sinobaca sp. H24 TaxID=2923376 RepID=UPI00207B0511|nr:hypothetical protein [Sinobaca sp. H24]